MTRRLAPAAAALVALALGACGGGDDAGPPSAAAPADADVTVQLETMSFAPDEIEVAVGDTVAFLWHGSIHDVVFEDGPKSQRQSKGVWSRTFDQPGTYAFVCTLHRGMDGTVTVR